MYIQIAHGSGPDRVVAVNCIKLIWHMGITDSGIATSITIQNKICNYIFCMLYFGKTNDNKVWNVVICCKLIICNHGRIIICRITAAVNKYWMLSPVLPGSRILTFLVTGSDSSILAFFGEFPIVVTWTMSLKTVGRHEKQQNKDV